MNRCPTYNIFQPRVLSCGRDAPDILGYLRRLLYEYLSLSCQYQISLVWMVYFYDTDTAARFVVNSGATVLTRGRESLRPG